MNGVNIQASNFVEIFKAATEKLQIFKVAPLYRKI